MPDTASTKRYRAFISYGHDADARLAPALQEALEQFARPRVGRRTLSVFLDRTHLPMDEGLLSSVKQALDDSEFFILLASPDAAASDYVRKEVDYWLGHASPKALLIVLTEGTIVYDEERHDFDWEKTTALPSNLSGVYADERRYLDMAWAKNEPHLSLRNPRFRDDVADLAAALHRKPKADMIGAHLDQLRQQRNRRVAVAGLLVAAAVAAGVFAVRGSQQRELAVSSWLADTARRQAATDPERALLFSLESMNRSSEQSVGASFRETLIAAGPRIRFERLKQSAYRAQSGLVATEFVSTISSRDGSMTVTSSDGFILRVERVAVRGTVTFSEHHDDVNGVDVSPDNLLVASVDQGGKGYVWEAGSGRVVFAMHPERTGFGYARVLWSPDGRRLLAGGQDSATQVWERDTWQQVAVFADMEGAADLLALSPDGRLAATGSTTAPYGAPVERWASVWETESGALVRQRGDPGLVVDDLAFTPDGNFVLIKYDAIDELWNPVTDEVIATWNDDGLAISSNLERGSVILDAAGSDGSGEGVLGVVRLGFTADGRLLATVDSGSNVLLWQSNSWTRLAEPDAYRKTVADTVAPDSPVREVKSPDGTLVVRVGDAETTGDVIDVSTKAVVSSVKNGSEPIVAAAFTPDGAWVAAADGTRYVRLHRWETIATLELLKARAASLVSRSLTATERAEFPPPFWQQFVPWPFGR